MSYAATILASYGTSVREVASAAYPLDNAWIVSGSTPGQIRWLTRDHTGMVNLTSAAGDAQADALETERLRLLSIEQSQNYAQLKGKLPVYLGGALVAGGLAGFLAGRYSR